VTPQEFVAAYLPYAQSVSQQTGLPTSYVLGQSAFETGWGTSNSAQAGHNFFGISPGGTLASYQSPAEGFQSYADLINSKRFSGWASSGASDPYSIASYINGKGYSTSPNDAYASGVAGTTAMIEQVLGSGTDSTYNWLTNMLSPGSAYLGVDGAHPLSSADARKAVTLAADLIPRAAIAILALILITIGLMALALKSDPVTVVKKALPG
jgi:hypothetical protein